MPLDPEQLVQNVDADRLRSHVAHLATGERHSFSDPVRHATAASYVLDALQEVGLPIWTHTFAQGNRQGRNLMAAKYGSEPELSPLLISAHYDTVPGSPGADDNASGVAALLECARVLSGERFRRSIQFVAFDMEETQPEGEALVGSRVLAQEVKTGSSYEGMYNLEMVGYTSGPGTQHFPPGFRFLFPGVYRRVRAREFRGDTLALVAQGRGVSLSRRFAQAAAQWVPELEVLRIETHRWQLMLPDMFRSDHAPFWRAGVPAIMISDSANFRNPNYHVPTDTPDTLDYAFLHRVTCALVATIAIHASEGG